MPAPKLRSRPWCRGEADPLVRFALCACAAGLAAVALAAPAWAYTPESPLVQQLVKRGVAYLETAGRHRQLGGECLLACTLLKTGADARHPRVARTVASCLSAVEEKSYLSRDLDNYSLALAVLLLCEADAAQHRMAIVELLNELLRRQLPGGGWSYPGFTGGDTSQSQYAVLALWGADHAGIDIPPGPIERACNWLLRTQTPEGAWGYHPEDPGSGPRRHQGEVRHSLAAAGAGSLYGCARLLGLPSVAGQRSRVAEDGDELPPALVPVTESPLADAARTSAVDPARLRQAQREANLYLETNYNIEPERYTLYYLYALERYFSFREAAEGRAAAEPKWYNDGVELLARRQAANGSWEGGGTETPIDTAFAVLFLVRSMRQSLQAPAEGVLHGGIGLPDNGSKVKLRGGRILVQQTERSLRETLDLLEEPVEPGEAEAMEPQERLTAFVKDAQSSTAEGSSKSSLSLSPPSEPGSPRDEIRRQNLLRLRRYASDARAERRLAAVRILASMRELDNVPLLINALADEDLRVALAARDGLRYVSRRFAGFGMGDEPDAEARRRAQAAWREWFGTVRPVSGDR